MDALCFLCGRNWTFTCYLDDIRLQTFLINNRKISDVKCREDCSPAPYALMLLGPWSDLILSFELYKFVHCPKEDWSVLEVREGLDTLVWKAVSQFIELHSPILCDKQKIGTPYINSTFRLSHAVYLNVNINLKFLNVQTFFLSGSIMQYLKLRIVSVVLCETVQSLVESKVDPLKL
jgi:hypothetical protein